MWADFSYDPVYVPQFGQWVVDGYVGAYANLWEGVCTFVVIQFGFLFTLSSDSAVQCSHSVENALRWAGIVSWIGWP